MYKRQVFVQAISGSSNSGNTKYAQDAIVSSNATIPCTITLGEGAVLQNFGGMSAVRVTDSAKLVMLSGSVIEDTTVAVSYTHLMLGGSKFRLRQGFNLRPKYLLSVNAPPVRGWLVLLKQNRKQL